MLLFSPNPADNANMGWNPSHGYFALCSIMTPNTLHVGRHQWKHIEQRDLVHHYFSYLRPVYNIASEAKTHMKVLMGFLSRG
jgi:hypothetical protein